MMALVLGYAIALGAAAWVLSPIVRGGGAATPPADCPNCGTPTERDARFCSSCGASLTS